MSDNTKQIEVQLKKKLAMALMQPHPELATLIMSDRGSAEIAEAINALIEHHCLRVIMRLQP